MNIQQLKSILTTLDVPVFYVRTDIQVQLTCPLAKWTHKTGKDSNPSCNIKFNVPGESTKYKCFACNHAGALHQLVDTVGRFLITDGEKEKGKQLINLGIKLMKEDKPTIVERMAMIETDWYQQGDTTVTGLVNPDLLKRFLRLDNLFGINSGINSELIPEVLKYVKSRGLSFRDAYEWDLMYDEHQGRLIFPVYSKRNEFFGCIGRTICNDPIKYRNYFGFKKSWMLGGMNRLRGNPRVIVVEGFIDLIKAYWWADSLACDIVCTFGCDLSDEQAKLLLAMDKSIQIWYDNDDAGIVGSNKAIQKLSRNAYEVTRASVRENDVGDMTQGEFQEIFEETKLTFI